ncbi:hypothetical protein E2C01_010652 [Portunus trituberculatus]|uniref:Uncharacterized protein n=1 Tax=Portunus trituberculatus TaxID=210409 RepID=A0A5B7D9B9_PORTR|nr:hypothetical protein [Portunus trituberculatus]
MGSLCTQLSYLTFPTCQRKASVDGDGGRRGREEEEGKRTPRIEFPHDRQFQDLRAEGKAVEMNEGREGGDGGGVAEAETMGMDQ